MVVSKLLRNACAAGVLSLGLASGASAATVTYSFGTEFSGSGSDPAGAWPWLVATFVDHVGGSVKLTLAATNLSSGEFVSGWYFNFVPEDKLSQITITPEDSSWGTVDKAVNAFQPDGDGQFDLLFSFPTSGDERFMDDMTAVYTITAANISGFGAQSFYDGISVNGPVGKDGFRAAARIQGLPSDEGPNEGSGWFYADSTLTGTIPVPLPASVWAGMALLGGIGLMKLNARRRMA